MFIVPKKKKKKFGAYADLVVVQSCRLDGTTSQGRGRGTGKPGEKKEGT